ncbi:MAG: DUF3618 domain-containing protein [Gemmatimonadales bacterium]
MSEYERHIEGVTGDVETGNGRTKEEIEREIERTRERMSENIDALGEKFSPQNLKQQAKDAITGRAQNVVDNVGEQARNTGNQLFDFIRENPLPVVAVGLGAYWLINQRNRSEISGDRMARFAYTGPGRRDRENDYSREREDDYSRERENEYSGGGGGVRSRIADRASGMKDSVSDAAGGVADRAGEFADRAGELGKEAKEKVRGLGYRAREQTRRARGGIDRLSDESPLKLVAGSAVVGLILGLLLPETQRESRVMGSTRDQLVDRAQDTVQRVKDAAVEAGREVTDSVKQEISERGPEVKSTLKDAASSVGEQVKESASRVKDEAKQATRKKGVGERGPGAV